MNTPLRIGIAGLGTVGQGTVEVLERNASLIARRCGRDIQIVAVSARDRTRERQVDVSAFRWESDPLALAKADDVDVVVELIGGYEGPARTLVEAALSAGKHVVTANKALIAHHAPQLAKIAESKQVLLAYEAAVAGGIPIVKALRDGLGANRVRRIAGIMNGTCNYILTAMKEQNREFDDVLAEAQALGYAEADPSFDVDGIDTAHKLAILTSLAYGAAPSIDEMYVEGIRRVTLRDIEFAAEFGYEIKLLGIAQVTDNGTLQRVHPCMVPIGSSLASVHGVFNAVQVECDAAGRTFFEGRGAGGGPTASAVVADLMDVARGTYYPPMTVPADALKPFQRAPMEDVSCEYYLRLVVIDRPGVLAEVTSIFRDNAISMRSVIQHLHQPGESVNLVVITHETRERAMLNAMQAIASLDSVTQVPYMMRIESI